MFAFPRRAFDAVDGFSIGYSTPVYTIAVCSLAIRRSLISFDKDFSMKVANVTQLQVVVSPSFKGVFPSMSLVQEDIGEYLLDSMPVLVYHSYTLRLMQIRWRIKGQCTRV